MKYWLVVAALLGGLGVALGAFGAHALKNTLDSYGQELWHKAVFYQMIHAAALLSMVLMRMATPRLPLSPAFWSFVAGILLFSGSLYLLALTGVRALGAVTPFGGLAFLFGWGWLLVVGFRYF